MPYFEIGRVSILELEYLAENGCLSAQPLIVLGQEYFLGATWLQWRLPKIDTLSSVARTWVAMAVRDAASF